MKRLAIEQQTERGRRYKLLTASVIVVAVCFAILQLILSNRLAGFSGTLASLEKQEKELTHENELLEKDIAKESSIMALTERAKALSFDTPSTFLVVSQNEMYALNR